METARPLALTMGDPAGIGGEIALQAWRQDGIPPFFAIDSAERLRSLAGCLGLDVPVRPIADPGEAADLFSQALPVLDIAVPDATPGQPSPEHAAAIVRSIELAVQAAQRGQAGAVVTNPIHKATMYAAGFRFPGHTEYLESLAGGHAVMMLACPGLRVVPVTIHLALRDAIVQLTVAKIVAAGEVLAEALRRDFGLARPRLAVAGLNPHAGEEGALGTEDRDIVAPAVARLRAMGIDARGPLPPDTMFHAAARRTYDGALCMYHDQALIPVKTIDFDRGVNVTLGLPIVRTSPDHGTAHDIAGTGQARETSLVEALRLAAQMASHRTGA